MQQNREPRNKPTLIWPINPWQKEARIYSGGKTISSINSVKKTGPSLEKELKWMTPSHHAQK